MSTTVGENTQDKIAQVIRDSNQAMSGIMTVLLQVQANLGMASEALEKLKAPAVDSGVGESVRKAVQSMDDLTAHIKAVATPPAAPTPTDPDEPTLWLDEASAPVVVEEKQVEQFPVDILTFGKFAKQVLSPNIVAGGRGFLIPNVYRDNLFFSDDSANLKRIAKWKTGYYNAGSELMLHTNSFVVVYPRLDQHDSLDAIEPIVFFKRLMADNLLTLHFIEKMDAPSLAILLEEVRTEFSQVPAEQA